MRSYKSAVSLVTWITFWIACTGAKAQMNEAQALAAIGFDRPVIVRFYTNTIIGGESRGVPTDSNTKIIALLGKSGHFPVIKQEGEPRWAFTFGAPGGTSNGTTVEIPVGKRIITQRSDEESWSEGSIKFYAKTITYTIKFDNSIWSLLGRNLHSLTLRLVEFRDPAVGHWQLLKGANRGTRYNQEEYSLVREALASTGMYYLDELRGNIADAVRIAKENVIQNQLAEARDREQAAEAEKQRRVSARPESTPTAVAAGKTFKDCAECPEVAPPPAQEVTCDDPSIEVRTCLLNTVFSKWMKPAEGPANDGMSLCYSDSESVEYQSVISHGTSLYRFRAKRGQVLMSYKFLKLPDGTLCPQGAV